MVDEARNDSLRTKDKRYLRLKGREAKLEEEQVRFREAKQKFEQEKCEFEERKKSHEQQVYCFKLECQATREQWRMDTLDLQRKNAQTDKFRRCLETQHNAVVRPYVWDEAKKREKVQIHNLQLEKDLKVAQDENSEYCRQLTEIRSDVAKEVERQLHRREDELVRKATEERDSAIRQFRDANEELRKAKSMNAELSETVRTVTERYDKLKEESDKHRQEQDQVIHDLQWYQPVDADKDSLLRGTNDDPAVTHVAALREIDRLHAEIDRLHAQRIAERRSDKKHLVAVQRLSQQRWLDKRRQACQIDMLKHELYLAKKALEAATDNSNNLPLTEKKDTANQTDTAAQTGAHGSTDSTAQSGAPAQTEASVQTDEVYVLTAEQFGTAETVYAEAITDLECILRKYLNLLDHICSLNVSADGLRDTVLDADAALDEIKRVYQDPNLNIQLTTLLDDDTSPLAKKLGQIICASDILVDGSVKTEDGIILKDEAELVRRYLSDQS